MLCGMTFMQWSRFMLTVLIFSLSAHTWYVGFLLSLACQGLLQEILYDVLHQHEYNRRGFYQPCLFGLTAWLCPSPLTIPRVFWFTFDVHFGFDYSHPSDPCPSLEITWNIALLSLSTVSTKVTLDALSPCSLELHVPCRRIYLCCNVYLGVNLGPSRQNISLVHRVYTLA